MHSRSLAPPTESGQHTERHPAQVTQARSDTRGGDDTEPRARERSTMAEATPAAAATPPAEQPAATVQGDNNLDSLFEAEPTPVEQPANAEATPAAVAEPEPETAAQQQHQEGTPDKALQKVQQELATTQRTLEQLLAKVSANEPLTEKQQQQVAQAPSKVAALRKAIADRTFDLFENGADLAEVLVQQQEQIEQLSQVVRQQNQEVAQVSEATLWKELSAKYPGVNVRQVWDQAAKDSEHYRRHGAEAHRERADELFHQRCDAAAKSVKAKAGTAPTKPTVATSKPSPTPVTPGGARVTSQQAPPTATAPASQGDKEMRDYLNLVVENE